MQLEGRQAYGAGDVERRSCGGCGPLGIATARSAPRGWGLATEAVTLPCGVREEGRPRERRFHDVRSWDEVRTGIAGGEYRSHAQRI